MGIYLVLSFFINKETIEIIYFQCKIDNMQKIKDKLKAFGREFKRLYRLLGLHCLKLFQQHYLFIMMFLVTVVVLVAEYAVVKYPTGDVTSFIFRWINGIRDTGFNKFYEQAADYSTGYLFLCALWSLLPPGEQVTVNGSTYYLNQMIYMKSFYYVMIIVMAIGIYLIVKHLTKSSWKASLSYCVTLVLPSVFVNASIWGQADVLIGAGLIYTIYFILKKKDWLAMLIFGITLGMKIHAIFIAPFLVYLILNRRIRLWTVLSAALGLFITFLPAYMCGANIGVPFNYLGEQTSEYINLSYGCGNMWHLVNYRGDVVNHASTIIGLSLIGVFTAGLYLRKINLKDDYNLVKVATLMIMVTIYFLPHMHERYFYTIDVLIVAYAFMNKKRFYLPVIMQLSSAIAYYHFLSGKYFIQNWGEDSVHICSYLNLFVLLVMCYDVYHLEHDNLFNKEIEEIDQEIESLKKK